jgi:acyl dehydratase
MKRVETIEPASLCYEDFKEAQELTEVTKGPMLVGHQVRWAGACDNYDAEFHHDEYVAKAQGLPGIILSGPLMASYMLTEVGNWVGKNGRLVSFWDRNSGSTMPRDLAHIRGRVTKTYEKDGKGYVEIECEVVNQDGKVTTPGRAVAELPLRSGTEYSNGMQAR